ncbi:Signal transduction histidine kinase [Mucilaginibacter pineti]|uniref:histidine kinase n=1 Tax=Mucilaginibacter pineti TaxID=1391627 RepID=A0A1G6SSE3_9SPHI|nr:ATP-binding protein [Mucilaginibacter pineti]SDD19718.1 Signal transduction histidine kinase [Mucilaginibacter pineti]
MIIKGLRLSLLFSLSVLAACGQDTRRRELVIVKDSLAIKHYADKSKAYQQNFPDSALSYADQGLKLSRKLKYRHGEGIMLDRLADINARYGNLGLAIKYRQEALTIFKTLNDAASVADTRSGLGILVARKGDRITGNTLLRQTLAFYRTRKDTAGIILSETRLGEVQELVGNHKQALVWYTEAEQLQEGRPLTDDYLGLISSIGKLHTRHGNHNQAIAYYEKGISKSSSGRYVKSHIAFLHQAGKAADSLGDKAKALDYHRRGLQKARENGLQEEEARSLMAIAGTLKNEDATQSITHLKNALAISRNIGEKQLSAEIYHSLSDIYRQQARYEEALQALEAHHRLLDSLQEANEGHKLAVLQGSYELAESRLHIESLELINRQRTDQRNEGLIAAIAVLLILLVLTFYFYKTKRLNQQLQSSNLIKDKLFSIIGHDLRNPIGGITQLLALMEEGGLSENEMYELVTEMKKQGNVTLEILNALLNWGEAQLKGIHIKPVNFNAKDSILKNMAALQQQAADKSIQIHDHSAAQLEVFGDVNHFDFIIRNLLSNAIKFSRPLGQVEISAEIQAGANQLTFAIKDYGKGISPEQQALFLKSNLDISYGTKGEKGTGIGLMLSKEFITANHGRIWLDSKVGEGTVFYFTFPQVKK